jgi:hypothetical protein
MIRNRIQIRIRNQLESRIHIRIRIQEISFRIHNTAFRSTIAKLGALFTYVEITDTLHVWVVDCRGTLKCTVLADFKLCRTLKFRGGDTITKAGLKRGTRVVSVSVVFIRFHILGTFSFHCFCKRFSKVLVGVRRNPQSALIWLSWIRIRTGYANPDTNPGAMKLEKINTF